MGLTKQRQPRSDDNFPTIQLGILAICRAAEPIALTSIFPYAWKMVQGYQIGDRNDASFYAGILISAFAFSEALTGMWWGSLSDRIGRKPVLLVGCFGTMLSLLMVGLSPNFYLALLGRVFGGLLNGNAGVIQTMVGEMVKKPEHEPRAYAVMPFVWSIGTIIGPAIGGLLADPASTMPEIFSEVSFLGRFPWLLPNVICSSMMLLSIVLAYFFLEETHANFCKNYQPLPEYQVERCEQTPIVAIAGTTDGDGVDLRNDSYGTFNHVHVQQDEHWTVTTDGRPASITEKAGLQVFTFRVWMLILCMGIFVFHAMSFDHLFPIFLQDEPQPDISILSINPFHIPGGLGLTTKDVGIIMSVNGFVALFIQAVIFPFLADLLGVWYVFIISMVIGPLPYFMMPYVALLPDSMTFAGIYVVYTIRNLLQLLAYPVILILLKQASPSPSVLGKINGLAASVGAGFRMAAPPLFGLLYGVGLDIGFTGIAWWVGGAVAILGIAQISFIKREKNDITTVKAALPCLRKVQSEAEPRKSDVVQIQVVECDSDDDSIV